MHRQHQEEADTSSISTGSSIILNTSRKQIHPQNQQEAMHPQHQQEQHHPQYQQEAASSSISTWKQI